MPWVLGNNMWEDTRVELQPEKLLCEDTVTEWCPRKIKTVYTTLGSSLINWLQCTGIGSSIGIGPILYYRYMYTVKRQKRKIEGRANTPCGRWAHARSCRWDSPTHGWSGRWSQSLCSYCWGGTGQPATQFVWKQDCLETCLETYHGWENANLLEINTKMSVWETNSQKLLYKEWNKRREKTKSDEQGDLQSARFTVVKDHPSKN